MKKIFLMLAAMGLIMSSCQKDENLGGSTGETLVTVTASVPQAVGVRAAGVGSDKGGVANVLAQHDLRYILWVYEGDATEPVKKLDPWTAKDQTSATMRLIPGHTYTFVVWADFSEAGVATTDWHYDTSAFPEITEIDHAINDETRDAYFVAETVKVGENDNITLTLKRPFGKVRMITTDWNENAVQAINPTDVKITYNEDLYKGINIKSGELLAAKSAAATYEAKIGTYTEAAENEKTLFVDYLFGLPVADATATAETVEQYPITFDIETVGVRTYEVKTAVPVTRNWLTTVKGNILTTSTNININVNPNFDNEHTTTSLQALQLAAVNGGDVTLTEDVVLTEPLNVTANMTINLGDYTISNATGYAIENTANLTINGNSTSGVSGMGGIRSTGGKITINGGTYTGSSNWSASPATYQHILKAENTEVVINDGTFDATIGGTNNAMINVSNGSKVTINGGEFKNVNGTIPNFPPYMFTYEGDGKLIINDGDFYGGWRFNGTTATTDIYGGNFTIGYDGQSFHANSTHVLTIYGGTFSTANGGKLNPSAYVADGYVAAQNADGSWSVVKGVSVNNDTALISAIQNVEADATIVLSGDITLPATNMDDTNNAALSFNNVKASIDLNGKTLKAGQADRQKMFYVGSGSDITITNGKLEIISTNGQVAGTGISTGGSSAVYCDGANITMNNVEIVGSQRGGHRAIEVYNGVGNFTNVKIDVNYGLGINAGAGATVTLGDCDITVTGMYSAPYNSTCFSVMGGGQMTVTSGNYKLINNNTYNTGASHGGWVGIIMSSGGNLTLNGGTYTNVPATGFMPQYERPLFSCDAVAGATSTLKFVGGTYTPQEDQIVHKGGSGGTEIVQIKDETLAGYSVNSALLEKMTNNGNGTWSL